MQLREYLDKQDLSMEDAAKKLGVAYGTIHNLLNGRDIKLSIAMRIEKATQGKVTCKDLFENTQRNQQNKISHHQRKKKDQ